MLLIWCFLLSMHATIPINFYELTQNFHIKSPGTGKENYRAILWFLPRSAVLSSYFYKMLLNTPITTMQNIQDVSDISIKLLQKDILMVILILSII